MIKLFLTIFCYFIFQIGIAQEIEVKGKVVDKVSLIPIYGVSVNIGKYGTSSNINGYFSITVDKAYFEQFKLTVTYVGYETIAVQANEKIFYNLQLELSKACLPEVIVSGNANKIIKRAIEKIPINFPNHTHIIEGLLRVYRTEVDSLKVYRFFKSDAVLSIIYPSYIEQQTATKVRVIQNKIVYLKLNELPADSTQWGGAYRIDNFIHQIADFVDINKMNRFRYHLLGKTILQGKKVWIISFESKNRKQISGTLFIDTACYAFVAAQYSRYNIPTRIDVFKRRIFMAINEISYDIVFQNIGSRWYLYKKSTKITYSTSHNISSNLLTDFVSTRIDTNVLTKSILENEYVQKDAKDNVVIKNAPDSNWKIYDSLFSSLENQKAIRKLQIPLVTKITLNSSNGEKDISFYKKMTFLENTFLRSSISMNHINIRSSSNRKGALGAGFSIGVKVHKNTYLHLIVGLNFGDSNKIISSKSSLILMRSFNLTNSKHPLFLAPIAGISIAELAKKSDHYKFFYNMVAGVTLSYPVIQKLAPYLSVTYDKVIKTHGKLNSYYFKPMNYSIGFYYSLN